MSGGIKHDSDKVKLDLLSPSWVVGVGQVLTFGASKYAAHNWRKGIQRSRLLGACLRHIFAYLGGEDFDPETGLLHLYHASCCLMFASELHYTRPELDDRYKGEEDGLQVSGSAEKVPGHAERKENQPEAIQRMGVRYKESGITRADIEGKTTPVHGRFTGDLKEEG